MNLPRDQWNFAAVMATLILLSLNGLTIAAVLTGLITYQEGMAVLGPIDGVAMGWVGKQLPGQATQ